jgi:hypothetical protein
VPQVRGFVDGIAVDKGEVIRTKTRREPAPCSRCGGSTWKVIFFGLPGRLCQDKVCGTLDGLAQHARRSSRRHLTGRASRSRFTGAYIWRRSGAGCAGRAELSCRRRVEAAGDGKRLVECPIVGARHYAIDSVRRERAFDDLMQWMESGVAPRGADLSGDLGRLGR